MKRLAGMISVVFVMLFAVGCAKGDKVKNTTMYMEKDKITEAIVEELDEEYYDAKKMKDWAKQEVDAYNQEHGGNALEMIKCEVKDEIARVTIEYNTMKDYSSFNGLEAFCGTIKEAEQAGYEFEGEFKSSKGKPSITHTELENSEAYSVVILAEAQQVILENEILYASPNVSVKGKKAVIGEEKGEPAYIIYKP